MSQRKQIWQSQLFEELFNYVSAFDAYVANEPRAVYDAVLRLKGTERRGIWDKIGKRLSASAKEVHNYFHNTWAKQFYDDIGPFKLEISELISHNLQKGLCNPRFVVQ